MKIIDILNNLVVKLRFAFVVVNFYDCLAALIPEIFKLSDRPVSCAFLHFAPCISCPLCFPSPQPTQNKKNNGVTEDKQ